MSKYNKRLRIRPVINSLVAEPRYYYECKDWYGGIGTGLTIPQAVEDYLKESLYDYRVKSTAEFEKLYKQEPAPYLPVVNQHKHNYIDTDGNVMVDKLIDAIFQSGFNYKTLHGASPELVRIDSELLFKIEKSLPKQGTIVEEICGLKVIEVDPKIRPHVAFWLE